GTAHRRRAGAIPAPARGSDQGPGPQARPAADGHVGDRLPPLQARPLAAPMALSVLQGACPVCAFREAAPVAEQNRLQVVRCPRCAQGYVWPVPSPAALQALYDGEYYRGAHGSVGFRDYGSLARARRRMFDRHLDRIERMTPRGRLLDVGCATGAFLLVA